MSKNDACGSYILMGSFILEKHKTPDVVVSKSFKD
jgi:hypothetical protein